jgi:threonine synthase
VAQAEAANPLYLAYAQLGVRAVAAKPTLASAIQIGNPVSVRKAIRTLKKYDGIVEQASEQELADAAAEADRTGMFNCPHRSVALAVLKKLVSRGDITSGQRVVVISTANGLKFTDFKIGYHEGGWRGITSRHANRPIDLPNNYDAVVGAIERQSSWSSAVGAAFGCGGCVGAELACHTDCPEHRTSRTPPKHSAPHMARSTQHQARARYLFAQA